jgi:hypothetical protein
MPVSHREHAAPSWHDSVPGATARRPAEPMNETSAHQVLLARAFDSAPPSAVWDEQDRAWARQATIRRVGEDAATEAFVVQRAALVARRLNERRRSIGRLSRSLAWRPWYGTLLVTLAFAAGLATDAVAAGTRINILAPPLLATLAWNLGVYLLLAARAGGLLDPGAYGVGSAVGPAIERIATRSGAARDAGAPALRFVRDWTRAAATLYAARAAGVLHAAAAAFAAGLLAGLYLRGLAFEYRAGWESTFLDASAVATLLGVVLGPASAVTGIALPDAARLAAIRFTAGPGENAAPWIHLHAATIGMLVILPRFVLMLLERRRARRLAADFPLALDDAYFQGLARRMRGGAARVPVVPYSYSVPATSVRGLHAWLAAGLDADVELDLAPAVSTDDVDQPGGPLDGPAELALALFNLSATPEVQTHADFVAALRSRLPADVPLLVAVDETAFRSRFGHEPRRLEERRAAWRGALAHAGADPLFVALGTSDAAAAAPALREMIEHAAVRPGTGAAPGRGSG